MLNLSLLSSISFASSTESEADTIDVHDIVPQEYFDKYAGVYSTKKEVLDAFDLELTSQGNTDETEELPEVEVDTVDEFAAFVAFVYGPSVEESSTNDINPNDIVEVEEANQAQDQMTTQASERKNFEVNLYEFGGIYTVKGYVTLIYNMPGGHITKTSASSALVGATQFASWTPDPPLIVATASYKREITFSGTLTTRLAGQEFINKRISEIGKFYSINVIE
jgi:hypothetical protein